MTNQEIITAIYQVASSRELDALQQALTTRRKQLHSIEATIALSELSTGTKVRFRNLRPKYVNGIVGEITGRSGEKFEVTVNDDDLDFITKGQFRSRFGYSPVRVPATCVEAVA